MNRRFIFFSLLLFPFYLAGQTPDTTINGVTVEFNYSLSIFPADWQQAPISAFGEKLLPEEVKRTKQVAIKALSKYPTSVLEANLVAVYFLKQMKFYNVGYGGTNSNDALYLVNNGIAMGYTDKYLEQTFHHEFSSILFRNFPALLDTNKWKNANDPAFSYNDPENGVGAIRNNQSSQALDTIFSKKGMLTQYATSSIENDVNTFAQNLFCPEKNFWLFVYRYSSIRKKATILISFYNKINPEFTEQYFRKLGTQ